MNAIVTGAAGFIGSALCNFLKSQGNEVIPIDRKYGNEAGAYFQIADLQGVNVVFHLAAQTSVFNTDKASIIRDNIETFQVVCDACARHHVKLIYASSSTANKHNTTSLYGISKQFDEEYARCYNPNATGVRFHNVYGPDPRQGTLLWHLLNDKVVGLVNEGKNVRHFTFIDDIIAAILYAVDCDRQLINAANPEETTVLEFSQIASSYNGVKLELYSQCRAFDNFAQSVDERIFNVPLHYKKVTEGIRRCFEYEEKK